MTPIAINMPSIEQVSKLMIIIPTFEFHLNIYAVLYGIASYQVLVEGTFEVVLGK